MHFLFTTEQCFNIQQFIFLWWEGNKFNSFFLSTKGTEIRQGYDQHLSNFLCKRLKQLRHNLSFFLNYSFFILKVKVNIYVFNALSKFKVKNELQSRYRGYKLKNRISCYCLQMSCIGISFNLMLLFVANYLIPEHIKLVYFVGNKFFVNEIVIFYFKLLKQIKDSNFVYKRTLFIKNNFLPPYLANELYQLISHVQISVNK